MHIAFIDCTTRFEIERRQKSGRYILKSIYKGINKSILNLFRVHRLYLAVNCL